MNDRISISSLGNNQAVVTVWPFADANYTTPLDSLYVSRGTDFLKSRFGDLGELPAHNAIADVPV